MRKAIAIVLLGLALYAAYPFFTIWRIQKAIQEQDVVTLDALVDWPRVRESIKNAFLSQAADKSISGSDVAAQVGIALGTFIGTKILDTAIESFVSSNTIFRVLEARGSENIQLINKISYAMFVSPTTFRFDFSNNDIDPPVTFSAVMSFSNLEWRVSSIVIPSVVWTRAEEANRGVAGNSFFPKISEPKLTLTVQELLSLSARAQKCWEGVPEVHVTMIVDLLPDGRVQGEARSATPANDPKTRAAIDKARNAIRKCQPYQMDASKYAAWRSVLMDFKPNN